MAAGRCKGCVFMRLEPGMSIVKRTVPRDSGDYCNNNWKWGVFVGGRKGVGWGV